MANFADKTLSTESDPLKKGRCRVIEYGLGFQLASDREEERERRLQRPLYNIQQSVHSNQSSVFVSVITFKRYHYAQWMD